MTTAALFLLLAATADSAAADSTVAAEPTAADSAFAADSTAAPDSAAVVFAPFRRNPTADDLAAFRLERSADLEQIAFGEPDDPIVAPGLQSLADVLRLSPSVRTREISQGPTSQSFELDGGGSGRADVLLGSRSIQVPFTSGPHTHEVMLSEISRARVVRGGAAALYGPESVSGAVVLDPAFPVVDDLVTRAFAEEGVDEYQRAGFQASRFLGRNAGFFLTTESRRIDGFFPGTKEVDRHFAGRIASRLPAGLEGELGHRRFEGDGRFDHSGGIGTIETGRTEWSASVLRPAGEGRGTLLEGRWLSEKLKSVVSDTVTTRHVDGPLVRVTADLPDVAGWTSVARLEAVRWQIEDGQGDVTDVFWRGAAALRGTRAIGVGSGFTGTVRVDAEENDRNAVQTRAEAWTMLGPATFFAVASRGERFADRAAVQSSTNEVHRTAQAGARLSLGGLEARAIAFATRIEDLRPEPTLDELRAHVPSTAAPQGRGRIDGATAGIDTPRFAVPGLSWLGRLKLDTSFTLQEAENSDTGAPLPRRAERIWTGEGFLEHRFFRDELLARARGRLTHQGGRVDEDGELVVDLWLTDVLLEGEVGDAVFFYRFHDLMERADEIEPGFRLPGFSRTYGITWRFRG
ncbi:MAG: TonB-dependent receptor [Candidatus Eiseniibacteriota bacterium]